LNIVLNICRQEYMVVPVPYKSITEVVDSVTGRLTDFFQLLLRPSASGSRGRQLLQTVYRLANALCACIHQLTRFCVQ